MMHWLGFFALVALQVAIIWFSLTYKPERPPSQGWTQERSTP